MTGKLERPRPPGTREVYRNSSGGFSLIGALLGMTIFCIATLSLMNSMLYSTRADAVNRETATATRLARGTLERLMGTRFADVYATFNDDKADDPAGTGTSPGSAIDLADLKSVVGGAGKFNGRILFPVNEDGTFNETLEMPEVGLPRDLNSDGARSASVEPEDLFAIPVIIEITWVGSAGERKVNLHTVLRP